jgi:hypothetical protein
VPIKATIIAAKIGGSKGIAIRPVGSKRWIIAWSIVKSSIMPGLVACAAISVAQARIGADAEAFVICLLEERRNAFIGWRRRTWSIGVIGMGGAASRGAQSNGEEWKSDSGRSHGGPHSTLSPDVLCEAFREVNAAPLKMLLSR